MLRVVLLALLVGGGVARQGVSLTRQNGGATKQSTITEGSVDWESEIEEMDGIHGSGDEEQLDLVPDTEDGEVLIEEDFGFVDEHKKKKVDKDEFEYYDEQFYEDYEEEEYDDDYDYSDENDVEKSSVLIIDEIESPPDIEIKQTKPSDVQANTFFDTSHILIMAGSALVSFGVVMLAFFVCRRSVAEKKRKTTAFILPAPRSVREASPIVRNYQKVPTTTKEFLQSRENAHIDMYRGDGGDHPAQYDPLLKY
jgi:hypothetical protein